ncbi:HIRA-interacting protein 3-like [Anopheles marshallii]|uniref:HIRA-interacting protein 3-like n=1 Tax=Anopheles marshallii TaxID=1521116 RepID=UPI00237A9588|nr:HIRA-interacting protein 3-like [Anopheles marshallii]
MEGYPYIQKVSSPYAAFQENASNPDKSTVNGSLEQPVYEQLMPSTLVVVNPYRYEAGIPSASNSVESTIVAPQTASCSGTYNIDPCSTAVVDSNGSLHTLAPERTPQYVPAVLNGQASNITNVSDKHSFAGGEPTVCNGASEDLLKDNPIPDKSCLTTLPEQTPESTLKRDDENIVPPNEKITMSTKEVDVHNSSKAIESIEPIEIITGSNACNQPYASAISNETSVKDNANHVQAPGTIDSASAEEKLVESNPDEDENSSDSTKSNSYTEAQHSENVSSLFKNVVLVQAHTIAAEENDSMDRVTSASEVNSFNETDEVDPIVTSSVEDIGREDEPMEHEMMDPAGLLIDETGDVQNFEIMEGVAVGQMGQIVALDAPIIDPTMMEEPENDADNVNLNEETNTDGNGSGKGLSGKENSSNVSVKQCKQLDTVSLSSGEETSEGCKDESQKCQMRKRGVIRVVNVKKELLQKKRSKTSERGASNDDPFGSCASSSSEDVPNDMYFGSPDRVYTVSTKLHWQRQKQKRNKYYSREKSTDQYSDASSDNEEKEHTQRRAKKAEEIARLKLPAYHQQQLQELVLKKHPKRGRFYDRSQDIPNDIYFGNVKVPLHILHATSSSSSEEEPWPGGSAKSATSSNSCHRKESTTYAKSSNNRYSKISSSRAESTSTYGSVRSVHRMKEYLKMAGFRHMRYQKLWQGCETNHERAEAILRFLQTHGLQGEPTDEKCRELRKQIQLQKEVEVLDTSVIIGSGEGRVTRQRTKKVSEPTAVAPDVNRSSEQSLQKDEETIESAAATETTELETECVQQQEQQQQDGNVPLENRVEHALPADECANRSNTPSNE